MLAAGECGSSYQTKPLLLSGDSDTWPATSRLLLTHKNRGYLEYTIHTTPTHPQKLGVSRVCVQYVHMWTVLWIYSEHSLESPLCTTKTMDISLSRPSVTTVVVHVRSIQESIHWVYLECSYRDIWFRWMNAFSIIKQFTFKWFMYICLERLLRCYRSMKLVSE